MSNLMNTAPSLLCHIRTTPLSWVEVFSLLCQFSTKNNETLFHWFFDTFIGMELLAFNSYWKMLQIGFGVISPVVLRIWVES